MTLIDRLTDADDETSKEVAISEIAAGLFLNTQGLATRAQLKTILGLDSTDDPQLDEIATFLGTLTTNEQLIFSLRVFFAGVLWETGRISLAQFKTTIGIT